MELVIQLAVLAFLVEAVVDTFKLIYEDNRVNVDKVMALMIGVLVALATETDIFGILGISTNIALVGTVLTGVLISRGGNFIHDLVGKLE